MVFVDTGAFLARYDAADALHARAVAVWRSLRHRDLATSTHVLAETWTLLARRAGYVFASERALEAYASPALEILCSTREEEIEAVQWFKKYADQRVSFTDCLSFVLMKRRRIRIAFTFDRHFHQAGFEVIGLPVPAVPPPR